MNCNRLPFDYLLCGLTRLLVTTDYFDGRTTNFSAVADLSRVRNMILEKRQFGIMRFKQDVGFDVSVNLGPPIAMIAKNYVFINSKVLRFLNKSVTITLYDLSFINPKVLMNGELCPSSICSQVVVEGNNMTFDVGHFTGYSITGSCSDGTLYGRCSSNKPKYCAEGILIDNCSFCGCSVGFTCSGNTCTQGQTSPNCTEGLTKACGENKGACRQGAQRCAGGVWGQCTGAIGPKNETCNGLDDDCDGVVDEGCELQGRGVNASDGGSMNLSVEYCPEGQIKKKCICEGRFYETGYCYNNKHFSESQYKNLLDEIMTAAIVVIFAIIVLLAGGAVLARVSSRAKTSHAGEYEGDQEAGSEIP
jgi:hypothetical protein